MGTKKRFSYESVEDVETIIKYLEAVRVGFLDGSLSFTHQDKSILLEPQGLLDFTLEASAKGKVHLWGIWRESVTSP